MFYLENHTSNLNDYLLKFISKRKTTHVFLIFLSGKASDMLILN